ncbi:phosphotransferase [Granulicella sp. L60]|uniref:phosphotransferase n=1 Tax=Granulicella sp. L60 TaxID=1641866 RepID=UPI00131E6E4D|nr:phosphotransferase [Granulicella sp. L60]
MLRKRIGLEVVVLDFLGERPGDNSIVLLESLRQTGLLPAPYVWAAFGSVPISDLNQIEQAAVTGLIRLGETGRGPFSRLGWIDDVIAWVDAATERRGSHRHWTVEQFNASATSSLARFVDDEGCAFWFKAVSPADQNEAHVTKILASLFSPYLPELIAFHSEWNAWLMSDGGAALSTVVLNPACLANVVERLAQLQKASIEHVGTLLANGFDDHRMANLRVQLPELTPYLEEAGRSQHAQTGFRIKISRIRQISRLTAHVIARIEELDIPATLLHCDFSLENILLSGKDCLFADWAQAGVGNPLVTFEQLRLQLNQTEATKTLLPRLTEIYRSNWADTIPRDQMNQAFRLLPLIAIASNLCCRREWLTASGTDRTLSRSYARILARQLDHAAQMIEDNISICA